MAIIRLILITSAMTLLAFVAPAHADWRRAESPNFIVYSQGSEGDLRRYTRNLEIYDYILRVRMGLPAAVAGRKLPIYLVRNRAGLAQIHPATGPQVAGTYFPVDEDIFAAAINDSEQDYLYHEYFHHFTLQMASTSGYPGWLIEGLAEYFMTAEVSERTVEIGGYNESRVFALLEASWIPLDVLLTKRGDEVRAGHRDTYYPLSWLLTHWFMSEEPRRQQLATYIRDLQEGTESVVAMERATGMTLTEITQQLRRYRRLRIHTYTADFPATEITVTRLPPSADDLLLIGQRLKVGVDDDQRAGTAALVRRLAASHPDDPFALLQLGHAELHFGDPEAGEAILTRLLEREPENVEALQLLATHYIRLAGEQDDEALPLMRRARSYLSRAYAADPAHYYTLQLLAETRQMASDYPSENDLLTWDRAFQLAPQLAGIRLGFANALMQAEEFDQAVVILRPLANAAHGGQAADMAATLMTRATNRQSPFTHDELATASEDEIPDEGDGQEVEPSPSDIRRFDRIALRP